MFTATLFPESSRSTGIPHVLRAESTGAAIVEAHSLLDELPESGKVQVEYHGETIGHWHYVDGARTWKGMVHAMQVKVHGGWRTLSVWNDLSKAWARVAHVGNAVGALVRMETFETEDEAWAG